MGRAEDGECHVTREAKLNSPFPNGNTSIVDTVFVEPNNVCIQLTGHILSFCVTKL